tara:strand:- start:1530 stop:3563 length:2034 start_codon:yes stop_codon:yes gene_type:complete
MKYTLLTISFLILASIQANAQSSIPKEYRGTEDAVARGVVDGNNIETNFRNHGEQARWADLPWGTWYTNVCDRFGENCRDIPGSFIDGIGFIVAGKVVGERVKWDLAKSDTTLNPVIINYREAGRRVSPFTGEVWGWLPLNGFNNELRQDPDLFITNPVPAISTDETSWPEAWPDKLVETTDAGWSGSWNGFKGKGLLTGDQETFYVMDDFSDKEYLFDDETDQPHSPFPLGIYYPSPSDSSIGGLGLQTEVRTFQFNDTLAQDVLFTQYRTTNVSEKDIDETWTSIIIDGGLSGESLGGGLSYNENLEALVFENMYGGSSGAKASFAFIVLEHSIMEDNGIDEDEDGIIDESKFNGPGELIEGKAAIDAYLEANYNMELFRQNYIDLENFPAYQNERWWTGDEDLDWIAYDDLNQNGQQDDDEPIIDDLGRDGLGPDHDNYPGPDEGEGDGKPTQGEPNFGEQDMLEAENRGLGNYELSSRPVFESGDNLRDDTWLFDKINDGPFELDRMQDRYDGLGSEEPFLLAGTSVFSLKAGTSSYFSTAIVFAETSDSLVVKIARTRAIYESDYGQSGFLTLPISNEEIAETPGEYSLSQNYPNPFNPSTNIEFSLSKSVPVNLTVFDITGREVRSLVFGQNYTAGKHSVQFDASDLSSGIYIYRLQVNGEVFTKKLTLIK